MNLNSNNKEIKYISLLSVLSAFAVVILHCAIFRYSAANPSKYWFISNLIMCLFFPAVPIFYMISGANLIDYKNRYDTKIFFKKRLNKVLLPFIFWVIFYAVFNTYFMHEGPTENILLYLYNHCINDSIYWFFIPLFGIYLIMPLFSNIPKENRIRLFSYLIALIFIFSSVVPFLIQVFTINLVIRPEFYLFSGFLMYPLLGYVLNEVDLDKKYRYIFYVLGILGLLGMFLPTQSVYDTTGQFSQMYKSYIFPTTALYAIAIWILVKQIYSKYSFNSINKIVSFVKPYTFGIYLVHFYLIEIIFHYLKLNKQSMLFTVGMPIAVIPLTIIVIMILKKIPYVQKLVP